MHYRDDLKAYLDGELDPMRSEQLRRAVEEDPTLANELRQLECISSALKSSPQAAPVGMEETLIALRHGRRKATHWGWYLGTGLATCLLCAFLFPVFAQSKSAAKSTYAIAEKSRMAEFGSSAADASAELPVQNGAARASEAKAPVADFLKARRTTPSTAVHKAAVSKAKETPRQKAVGKDEGISAFTKPSPATIKPEPQSTAEIVALAEKPTELAVHSLEQAESAIRSLAPEYGAVVVPEEAKRVTAEAPNKLVDRKEIVIELPEDEAKKLVERLKKLPEALSATAKFKSQADLAAPGGASGRGSLGGGGGFGGAGGGAAGSLGSSTAAPAANREQEQKKDTRPKKRIRIVLVKKAEKSSEPGDGSAPASDGTL